MLFSSLNWKRLSAGIVECRRNSWAVQLNQKTKLLDPRHARLEWAEVPQFGQFYRVACRSSDPTLHLIDDQCVRRDVATFEPSDYKDVE